MQSGKYISDELHLYRNNPHPQAWKIVEGMTYSEARRKLKQLWATRAQQDLVIHQASENNAIKSNAF